MHRTGAAESINDEFFRQITGAHDLTADQIGHLGVDDFMDARRGFVSFEFERLGDVFVDGAERFLLIKVFPPAKKITGIDDAECKIPIGDGDLCAAGIVQTGPGLAPALRGPTSNLPVSASTCAMVPPPAP